MTRQPIAVGAYIFAGGFTLGVKRAGFKVLAQLEDGPYGVATAQRNHPGLPVYTDPATWPLDELAATPGGVDLVYGNPPCAPWSNAGTSPKKVGQMGVHWKMDPRTLCVTKLFTVLERVRPVVWAWESVQPALRRGRELVDELTEVARTQGYAASYVLLNAIHLGVPQVRRRVFFVFHRVAIDWAYPAPEARVTRTVRDAWQPLLEGGVVDGSPSPPELKDTFLDLLATVPQGGSALRAWEQRNPPETWVRTHLGRVKGRPRFLDVRLAWDRPSPTLTGGATKFHPEHQRFITLLEQQLLCGYPVDYVFEGRSLGDKYAQTAQAVMPPVGEWLARNVRTALERGAPVPDLTARIVDLERGEVRLANDGGTTSPDAGKSTVQDPLPALETLLSLPITLADALAMNDKSLKKAPQVTKDHASSPSAPDSGNPPPPAHDGPYAGPTALACALLVRGADDQAILEATRQAFGPGAARPLKFTGHDLKRLRERIAR